MCLPFIVSPCSSLLSGCQSWVVAAESSSLISKHLPVVCFSPSEFQFWLWLSKWNSSPLRTFTEGLCVKIIFSLRSHCIQRHRLHVRIHPDSTHAMMAHSWGICSHEMSVIKPQVVGAFLTTTFSGPGKCQCKTRLLRHQKSISLHLSSSTQCLIIPRWHKLCVYHKEQCVRRGKLPVRLYELPAAVATCSSQSSVHL